MSVTAALGSGVGVVLSARGAAHRYESIVGDGGVHCNLIAAAQSRREASEW